MINKQYFEIQELVEAIIDNRGKTVPTSENGIPLIATNCIKHSSIFPTFENIRYINQETYDNWFRAHLKPNDILFVNKGTPGRCCIVPNPVSFVAAQDMVGLRFKKHLNPYYMLAVLRSKEIQNTIENNHVGLVIAHFRKQELVKLKLPILEETIRNKIGDFYEIISKKIELNNRINAELEAMAKTLYDYWFVQFDFPVASTGSATEISGENVASTSHSQQSDEKNTAAERSQETVVERRRGYKSSGGKMVYNETLKREIPEGWEVKKMSFFEMYQPQTISEKELNNNHKYYVFGANGIIGKYDKFNHLDSEIVVTCRGNSCGNIIRTLPESWITGNAMVIKSIEDYIESEFIFQMLNWIGIKKVITGSGQPQITRVNLETLDFVLPKRNILSQFNKLVRPIVEKKLQLFKQNQELSALRDWLLPMLMNGQVKVG